MVYPTRAPYVQEGSAQTPAYAGDRGARAGACGAVPAQTVPVPRRAAFLPLPPLNRRPLDSRGAAGARGDPGVPHARADHERGDGWAFRRRRRDLRDGSRRGESRRALKTSRLDTQPAPGKRRRGRRAERHGHRRGKRVAAAGRAPGPRGRRGDNAGPGGRGQALESLHPVSHLQDRYNLRRIRAVTPLPRFAS